MLDPKPDVSDDIPHPDTSTDSATTGAKREANFANPKH